VQINGSIQENVFLAVYGYRLWHFAGLVPWAICNADNNLEAESLASQHARMWHSKGSGFLSLYPINYMRNSSISMAEPRKEVFVRDRETLVVHLFLLFR
jgi:hypothetical protein